MKISRAYSLYFLTAVPIFANILNSSEIKASSLFCRKMEVIKQNIRTVESVRGGSGSDPLLLALFRIPCSLA